MKKLLLFVASLCMSFFCLGQSYEIEALKKQLESYTKQDTARVNRLNELCNAAPRLSNEDLEKYGNEALELSRRLDYPRGGGFALLTQARLQASKNQVDSAENLILQAERIAKETNDELLLVWVYYRLSGFKQREDIRESARLLTKAEEIATKLGDKRLLLLAQNEISSRSTALGDYTKALDYGVEALKLAEELDEPVSRFSALSNLADVYILIGEYEKGSGYLQELIELNQQLGFGQSGLAGLYNGLGENYRLSDRPNEAIASYEKALSYSLTDLDSLVPISNIADVYVRMDNLPKAFEKGYESLTMNNKLRRPSLYGWIYGILARAHLKEGNLDSAVYYGDLGYRWGQDLGIMEDLRDNSASLAEAYAKKNDYKNALSFFQNYISYRDSMVNDKVKNRSLVLEHDYELEMKEDQIALLSEQQRLQRNFLYSSLVVLVLILVAAFLLLRNIRQKQKANRLLLKQKQEIDAKAKELAAQKDILQKSYNNVELLGEIGRKITSSLSVEKIIGTVYDNVNGLMDASIFGIGIYHDANKALDFPATYENGHPLPPYSNAVNDPNRLAAVCFSTGKEIIIQDLEKDYSRFLQKMPTPIEGKSPASLIYLPLVSKGKLFGVVTVQSFNKNAFTDYHVYMLRSIALYTAIALENAESFNQLNSALDTLQETQAQLIQSEKMASLGELTAGIAHEIQNPLNFVNNFAEVSVELVEEIKDSRLKTQDSRQKTEEDEILEDIKQNLEKIRHHGKRADSIVKGMLEHSRKQSGEKVPTDINALADEYLRLAYHGMRAKDKSFNADFKMDFDPNIPKVGLVAQDMGRVLLNLVNNAFYAVNEKSKQRSDGFKPTVTVKTSKKPDRVELMVLDNGSGIPEHIREKIFQPFFTTKPTGSGTGLGLSLSYDIVKAHGGDIRVESSEESGTQFIISLPF
ncbi:ATP-binding protein [Mariniradius sediminis]|uniref:histidine kinase n=1 Tax=Mariniradius sediminis TaxID=2909237 RepID=A0ABS9BYU3_9BACT|nr:ATP-binding protein [Mariniradius sediminis]MCF1753220.1 ATP-binding protein [Mariniradius sediminis]